MTETLQKTREPSPDGSTRSVENAAGQSNRRVPHSTRRTRWVRPSWPVLLVSFLALAGVALLLLPSTAGWFSQAIYSKEIQQLSQSARVIQPEIRAQKLEQAREYNQGLVGAVTVGANQNVPQATYAEREDEYHSLLSADSRGLMARIKIPAINADLPIYHGTDPDVLEQGVGHLRGTALPVGGMSTHSVLTAHRGLAKAELFTNLDQVVKGDTFTIEVFGEVLTYKVMETQVVEPHSTESLFPQTGRDLVTLITCTPLGVNTHRILVTGERITPTPIEDIQAAGTAPEVPGFPWWALGYGVTFLFVGTYIVLNCRRAVARADL